MTSSAQRLPLLDGLRGFSLVSMAAYHLVWDLAHLFGAYDPRGAEAFLFLWQQSVCWPFIFLSGFSFCLGRRPLRRGAEIFLCGALVTAASLLFFSGPPILFGILTFLGTAPFLLCAFRHLPVRLPAAAGLKGSLCLFALFHPSGLTAYRLPAHDALLFSENSFVHFLLAFLGFPPDNFSSLDYFPLLPWFFLYAAGYWSGRLASEKNLLSFFRRPAPRLLTFAGRHSLLFYLLHQPLLVAALSLYFSSRPSFS